MTKIKKGFIWGILLIAAITAIFVFCTSVEDTTPPSTDTPPEVEEPTSSASGSQNLLESDSETIPDFTLPDADGKQVAALNEVARHRLTILDFWASWCGPCRAEMPNLVKVYNTYKDKGLGIIGISLDEDRGSWLNAIDKMNMTWLQLSDLNGWDSSAARIFGVNSIPATLLVNSKGQVVAVNLRGEQLERFVKESLK